VPFAIVSGGIACVVGAVAFAVRVPSFAHYTRHRHDPSPSSDPGRGPDQPADEISGRTARS
jgi:hypothetical protein